jgi:Uma2 family endonuclease
LRTLVIGFQLRVSAMSTVEHAETKTILPPLVAGQQLDQPTFHERYEAMPDGQWAELVGGRVYIPSPVRYEHSEYDGDIGYWYNHYKRATKGLRSGANATVILGPFGETQPDGHLRIPQALGGQTRIERGYIVGAPELVIEVSRSSRSYDLSEKKTEYEQAGVLEYIIVELEPDRLRWFILRNGRFEDLPVEADGIYRSHVFPGLWLDADALFAEDLDRVVEVLEQGLRTNSHAAFVASLIGAGADKMPR